MPRSRLTYLLLSRCGVTAQGAERYFRCKHQTLYAAVLFVTCVDLLVRSSTVRWPTGHLNHYLRLALLVLRSRAILQELRLVIATFKPLAGVLIVLGARHRAAPPVQR